MTEIADLTAVELAQNIRTKSISPVEATKAILSRIEARSDLNAFITVCADEAIAEAKKAEKAVVKGETLGPLHGVPYSVKDLLNTAGVRTTMGSKIFAHNVPREDAISVARARKAGAILVGKTTTPEFGHVQSATSPLFGRTYNPLDRTVTPGASSSGSAVAVASGMGPISLGTDGGGSSRIPAACCGVVGYKPTLGIIPHLQLPDLFGANSYVGPLARNVPDVRLVSEVLFGASSGDPYGQAAQLLHEQSLDTLKGLKVGWIATGGARIEQETAAITSEAVRRLEKAGATIVPIEINLKSFEPAFLTILRVGLAARSGPLIAGKEDMVTQSLVDTISFGRTYSAVSLSEATAARSTLFRQVQTAFEKVDILVSPTLTAPPLSIDIDPTGEIEIDGENCGTIRGAWYPFTFAQNLTGHPAISLPCGFTKGRLPIGLQFCAPWYKDRYLFDVAYMFEQLLQNL